MSNIFFGDNLKFLRSKVDKKLSEIPIYTGFKSSQWNNWELQTSFPKFEDFLKISKLFEISLDSLVFNNLAEGGDLPIKRIHKLYSKGGDYGGDEGGDWLLKEDIEPFLKDNSNKDNSMYLLRSIIADKTATIADLKERISELKAYNSTLIERIEDFRNSEQFTGKQKSAG